MNEYKRTKVQVDHVKNDDYKIKLRREWVKEERKGKQSINMNLTTMKLEVIIFFVLYFSQNKYFPKGFRLALGINKEKLCIKIKCLCNLQVSRKKFVQNVCSFLVVQKVFTTE